MNERDEVLLRDMLDAANAAQEFMAGKDRSTFESEKIIQFAVVRAIEIIGEAASRVSEEFRSQNLQIEWRPIIGMRNRIIHEYGNVDLNTVWDVVESDIPKLIAQLVLLVPPVDKTD